MARARRTTNKNNIVILCEGTDTEVNYFEEMRDYVASDFDSIKIVPIIEEVISPKNTNRKQRKLKPSASLQYYEKEEKNIADYNRYKAQPVRYVREVQLIMQEDGYVEGWAVFDKDTFTHHAEAFELAESIENLHIAFSSYCIEEWFLTHFERNSHPFLASVCKDLNGKDKGCGTGVVDDCHGTICLGGRLRECGYIPNYSKNKDTIFQNYTLPRLEQCYMNAAWIRTLSSSQAIYERNPYTDVDVLVKRLLGDDREHHWHRLDEPFDFCGSKLIIHRGDEYLIFNNSGSRSFALNGSNGYFCNSDLQICRMLDGGGVVRAGEHCEIEFPCEHETLLCLKDGYHIHYISLK